MNWHRTILVQQVISIFLPPYTGRENIWEELAPNPGPLAQQATTVITRPRLIRLVLRIKKTKPSTKRNSCHLQNDYEACTRPLSNKPLPICFFIFLSTKNHQKTWCSIEMRDQHPNSDSSGSDLLIDIVSVRCWAIMIWSHNENFLSVTLTSF